MQDAEKVARIQKLIRDLRHIRGDETDETLEAIVLEHFGEHTPLEFTIAADMGRHERWRDWYRMTLSKVCAAQSVPENSIFAMPMRQWLRLRSPTGPRN